MTPKPMRWFLDTEFNEDGRTIELISIALVNELGSSAYYAHSADYDPEACNPWVKEHVLPYLKDKPRIPRAQIAAEIRILTLGNHPSPIPEFWADYASYDWVALCQLYGPMVSLPAGFPFWCRDLQQLIEDRRFDRKGLPGNPGEHDALNDAMWCRAAYLRVMAPRMGTPAPYHPPGAR